MLSPEVAREWATIMLEAADAAERDVSTYLQGAHPDDGSKR